MTAEEALARLREIEQRVRELRRATDLPVLERTMQTLDLYCHVARWELGDHTAMLPETDTGGT